MRRLVLLSGRGEPEAQRCEEIVMNSGAQWTVLRCSWFNQNFSENYLLQPILAGEVALPVSVSSSLSSMPMTSLMPLSRPRRTTSTSAALRADRAEAHDVRRSDRRDRAASGRQIRFVQISVDDYVATLEQAQLPTDLIALIKYLFTEVLDGRNAYVTDGVQRALGRAPAEFAEYARRAASSGAWAS
jgi:uncharacterized protein YbjT (DUF2867 family)